MCLASLKSIICVFYELLIMSYMQVISMLKERLGVQKDKNLPMVDYRYLHEEAFKHQNFSMF